MRRASKAWTGATSRWTTANCHKPWTQPMRAEDRPARRRRSPGQRRCSTTRRPAIVGMDASYAAHVWPRQALGYAVAATSPADPISSRGFSDVLWCCAVQLAEATVEIGKISKANAVGDDTHRLFGELGFTEHAMRASETLVEQPC